MRELICCQVVRVLSNRDLVISAGSSQGVEEGMLFDIRGYVDIEDPDTEEILESLLVTKVRVRISQVGKKVSVASTFRQTQPSLATAWLSSGFVGQVETIKSDDISRNDIWEKVISIGDEAVQVTQGIQT